MRHPFIADLIIGLATIAAVCLAYVTWHNLVK